jgi:tetratricopeptide (TPR) repeat protein
MGCRFFDRHCERSEAIHHQNWIIMMKTWARTLLAILALAMLLPAAPVLAAGTQSTPTAPATTKPPLTANQIADLTNSLRAEQRAADKEEIRANLLESQRDWYGIYITWIFAIFSALVTAIFVIVSLRVKSEAIAEAKHAAITEIKPQIDEISKDIDSIKALKAEVEIIAADISAKNALADELINKLNIQDLPNDAATKQKIADRAQLADQKPRNQHDAADYRALIMRDVEAENWPSVAERAVAMAYQFADSSDENTIWALFAQGVAFGKQGKPDEEIAIYNDLIDRFGDSTVPALQEQMAKALLNKGVAFGQQNKPDEAIAAYEKLIARFGDSSMPALQELVAKALFNKGNAFGQQGKPDEAIIIYNDLIAHFGHSTIPALQEWVAKALFNKGMTLGQQKKPDEEIAIYNELIARFGDSTIPALQEQVAKALFNKACVHARSDDEAAAIAGLRAWRDKLGRFDCDMVANDDDFNTIRDAPEFQAFLVEMGCVGGSVST